MARNQARASARRLPLPSAATLLFLLLNVAGLAAYLHPFLFAGSRREGSEWFMHAGDGPLILGGAAALCLAFAVTEAAGGGMNSKALAALAVLAALAAVLRTVTLPAGANLYFFLVIIAGYSFGPRMGFLVGAFSFFLSALVTGGVGPWLPFQAFASAWMGASAGLLRPLARALGGPLRLEVALLALFGAAWGLVFGAITNLWFWPFWVGGADVSYEPGIGALEALRRYWNFYLLTSLGWDLFRSACNAVAILALAGPLLKALARFRDRFTWEFELEPWPVPDPAPGLRVIWPPAGNPPAEEAP